MAWCATAARSYQPWLWQLFCGILAGMAHRYCLCRLCCAWLHALSDINLFQALLMHLQALLWTASASCDCAAALHASAAAVPSRVDGFQHDCRFSWTAVPRAPCPRRAAAEAAPEAEEC